MNNFRLVATGLDVSGVQEEIQANPSLWWEYTGRQKLGVQVDTLTIPLRTHAFSAFSSTSVNDIQQSELTPQAKRLPVTLALLQTILGYFPQGSELARAMLVLLRPYCRVYSHIDRGAYYVDRKRYHLGISVPCSGSILISGSEDVSIKDGELWWFDNKRQHEALNMSADHRIHLIFDITPSGTLDDA